MSTLFLDSAFPEGTTAIPNDFLDNYMPRANGAFVKVYLLLFREAQGKVDITLPTIADKLHYTEMDVLRALKYWEDEKLISLKFKGDELTGISLLSFPKDSTPKEPAPERAAERRIDAARIKELSEKEDVREILYVAQQYLGKLLSPTDTQKLLYFYDELRFTPDLIEYLIEYCVSKGKTDMRYIEKVGLNWYNDGIQTVKDARSSITNYNKDYYSILKMLGLGDRHPIEPEIALMKKWIETYKFPMDIISEACVRTVMNTNKPGVKYADSILKSWHEEGVKTKKDIDALDKAHSANKKDNGKTTRTSKKAGNWNFPQRQYDFDDLEKKLHNTN